MAVLIRSWIEVRHDGMDGEPVLRRRLDDDMSRSPSSDMCSVRGIGVALMVSTSTFFLHLLQPLLVLDAEALLFVDHQQAEIVELDVLREQAMRADRRCPLCPPPVPPATALISFGERKRLSISTRTGKGWKRRLKVSKCWRHENGGRSEHRHLLAVAERFEGRAHGHFGLAEADVAAQQAVHRVRALHVLLDLLDGA